MAIATIDNKSGAGAGIQLLDINPTKVEKSGSTNETTSCLVSASGSSSYGYSVIPVCGYSKLAIKGSTALKAYWKLNDGTLQQFFNAAGTAWTDYLDIPANCVQVLLEVMSASSSAVARVNVYYSLLTADSPYNPDNQTP